MNSLISIFLFQTFWLLAYLFLFRKQTSVFFRRVYLVAALILPLVWYKLPSVFPSESAVVPVIQLPEVFNTGVGSESVAPFFSGGILLLMVPGLFLSFFRWMPLLSWFFRARRKERLGELWVYFVPGLSRECSFFYWVFVPENTQIPNDSWILRHELVHYRRWHSLDLLLMEAWLCVYWMNPFLYWLRQELQVVHEYEADQDCIAQGNTSIYAEELVARAMGSNAGPVHHFSLKSQLKYRLIMLYQPQTSTSRHRIWMAGLLVAGISILAACQQKTEETPRRSEEKVVVEDLSTLTQAPEFPGGTASMIQYLSESLKYPESMKEDGVAARVVVSFVVGEEGKVRDATIVKSGGRDFDEEALHVVNAMPDWKAGTQGRKAVAVKMMLPIQFSL